MNVVRNVGYGKESLSDFLKTTLKGRAWNNFRIQIQDWISTNVKYGMLVCVMMGKLGF